MRKKYQSYRILPARTVSATHPRNFGNGGGRTMRTPKARSLERGGGGSGSLPPEINENQNVK